MRSSCVFSALRLDPSFYVVVWLFYTMNWIEWWVVFSYQHSLWKITMIKSLLQKSYKNIDFLTRSFTRSFWKCVDFCGINDWRRVTEVPTGEEIRFFPLFFSKKVARRFARRWKSILCTFNEWVEHWYINPCLMKKPNRKCVLKCKLSVLIE